MARADPKDITWVLLHEAKALVTEAYGSPQLAERLLLEWLKNDKVRGTQKFIEARVPKHHPLTRHKQGAPLWGQASFWLDPWLHVNWDESWARRSRGRTYITPYKIVVSRDDLLALLPQEQEHRAGFGAAKVWVVSEAERLKAAGRIPADIRKTALARLLADKMHKAARRDDSVRPVGERYISNSLKQWGLWPVSTVK
jgi:hypothetical protein